ncbi:hypothetical protein MBRA1_000527 [Malassezia brasiliensis]|uniref:DM2 domain-containing protein n=1 Tax=Malassezia brasiliensis TaxID=1821822 RepID=A0AAF0INN7_9BASI|nr:hypothetical protein MBRA1_000527 [Malassezia brasiliensis]
MSNNTLDPSALPALRERIFDVLRDSDLSVVSAKKIRVALSEMPEGSLPASVNLVDQKKAVDAEIRKCYDEVTQKGTTTSKSSASTESDVTDASKKRAAKPKAAAAPKKASKKRGANAQGDEEPKKKRAPNPNSPLNRPMRLSSAMAEVCGGNEMPRHGVVKQLWAYIKEHNLQNESNKRQVRCKRRALMQIMCDAKLSSLFGKDTVDSFEMAKLIGPHLEKIEPST